MENILGLTSVEITSPSEKGFTQEEKNEILLYLYQNMSNFQKNIKKISDDTYLNAALAFVDKNDAKETLQLNKENKKDTFEFDIHFKKFLLNYINNIENGGSDVDISFFGGNVVSNICKTQGDKEIDLFSFIESESDVIDKIEMDNAELKLEVLLINFKELYNKDIFKYAYVLYYCIINDYSFDDFNDFLTYNLFINKDDFDLMQDYLNKAQTNSINFETIDLQKMFERVKTNIFDIDTLDKMLNKYIYYKYVY